MAVETNLPAIDEVRDVLGLTLDELASAVHANPSTLYRWRTGEADPNQASLDRLRLLEELANTLRSSLRRRDRVSFWLDSPTSVFGGRSALDMIREGRAETVLGALLSHAHLLRSLEAAEGGGSGFAELLARQDLSLRTKAALALLDGQVADLVGEMQTEESRTAAAKAFGTRPRVRLGTERTPNRAARKS